MHAIPKLSFPGGALIGCSAGFLNAVKIKGSHTAMKSGMLAAEAVFELLADADPVVDGVETRALEAISYEPALLKSWVADELKVNINFLSIRVV